MYASAINHGAVLIVLGTGIKVATDLVISPQDGLRTLCGPSILFDASESQ